MAHWAHVGGFVFGAGAALLLKVTGLEHTANRAIEEKTEWNNAPEIASATEFFERGELDQATATLKDFLAANPDSLDACNLLQQIYWRKSDIPAYQEITIKLCSLYMKAKDPDVAWQHYDEYLNTGGGAMPADTWLELCRGAESQNNLERGLSEYEKLASTYSAQRHGLQAQIGAGRIALKLNRPDQALKFYEAAAASSVPHLDWEQTIAAGIREAKRVIASPALTTR